jgi:hypothetical protein
VLELTVRFELPISKGVFSWALQGLLSMQGFRNTVK